MKKYLFLVVALISSCRTVQLHFESKEIDSVCIDGVKYYMYGDNFALAVNKNAEIVICEPDTKKGFWNDVKIK